MASWHATGIKESTNVIEPYFADPDVTVYLGHCLDVLAALPEKSIQCVVTSPPYYGLRSYGTPPQVWGGDDPGCQHEWGEAQVVQIGGGPQGATGQRATRTFTATGKGSSSVCLRCNAWRGELGQEPTLALYLDHLLSVFDAVWRVLRDDGTCWVNIGDSYSGSGPSGAGYQSETTRRRQGQKDDGAFRLSPRLGAGDPGYSTKKPHVMRDPNLKPKDLMLVPFHFAIRMQAAGWYVRNDNIWAKTACMPESVTDRATRSHEYVFHFTKSARYYYDGDAVREEHAAATVRSFANGRPNARAYGHAGHQDDLGKVASGGFGASQRAASQGRFMDPRGRNQRTVWTIGPEPLADEHYASYPSEIPRRCILAGTSEKGQCPACGKAWRRVVEKQRFERPPVKLYGGTLGHNPSGTVPGSNTRGMPDPETVTLGWSPTCQCDAVDPIPQTVLDPFLGSGRTAAVARHLGRHCIGIELQPEYAKMIRRQLAQQALPLLA